MAKATTSPGHLELLMAHTARLSSDSLFSLMATKPTSPAHTKGQWKAKPATLNPRDALFYKANVFTGGIRVAQVAGVGEEAANANARLIAAAPELLEACKMLLNIIDDNDNLKALLKTADTGALNRTLVFTRPVIAKAEGR